MEERERDEYGMEEVEGLFSSPEKSPAKLNGFSHSDDDTASSEMSIEDGRHAENRALGIYLSIDV